MFADKIGFLSDEIEWYHVNFLFLHWRINLKEILFDRQYSTDYKLDTYLKIARLYLEDEDPVQAEAYINRASLLQTDSRNHELQIHYKVRRIFVPIHINSKLKLNRMYTGTEMV